MRSTIVGTLALAGLANAHWKPSHTTKSTSSVEWETAYTATAASDVAAAAATAKTSSPTSKVKGKAFDRVAFIWFENENYDKAAGDPNFQYFAKKGITLDNYFAVTHPSEPNYIAAIAGDYFGMQNDDFWRVDRNVSTVHDLLDERGISWGYYQEDMPFSGFEGKAYKNQNTGANDYVRKHNPGIIYDSVTHTEQGLSQIKNLSMIDTKNSQFHKDLKANKLPQWMFITPNMTSDGHDTDVTTAGAWCKKFLDPLLEDKNFMDNTLVVITWDENESYAQQNNIFAVLIGDAVPKHLVGTTDSNFYNHYSEIASVQANWDLHTLGRWDVGANVYDLVSRKTHDRARKWDQDELDQYFWNSSYSGIFNDNTGGNHEYPAPNLRLDRSYHGRSILPSIKRTWKRSKLATYYKDSIENNDGMHPPKGYEPADE